jgi:ribosomal protein L37AE/L43A
MLRAQHKSRSSNSAPAPMVCEVCRRKPVEAVVVEFIFACDRCAEKIRAATGDQRPNIGSPFSPLGTDTEPSIP